MPIRRRVTLADVAAGAGVSRTTASLTLTGRDGIRISPDVQRRVVQVAQDLGYRPNLNARGLRTAQTYNYGFVSDTITSQPYAGEAVRGAVDAALEQGRLVLLGETGGDPGVEDQLLRQMLDRQVDGLVYASMVTREVQLPATLRGQRVVLLNCVATDAAVPAVVPDEYAAGLAAAGTLLAAGHTDGILVVGEPTPWTAYRDRLAGIGKQLAEAGAEPAEQLPCAWHPEHAFTALSGYLRHAPAPRAVICLNDRIALGVYQALAENGLAVPADVSVISFDDTDLATWLRPQLTSFGLPHHELGRLAVSLLDRPDPEPAVQRLPMPLRHRQSVGPPRRRVRGRTGASPADPGR